MASAQGPHLQQVVVVPVSLSCDSGGGQKGRVMGGGSIHKLPRALPGRNVALSPLRARGSTAGTVAPGTYSTCSCCRCWTWFPRSGPGGSARLCVFQNRLYASRTSPSVGWRCPVWMAALRMWFSRTDSLGHSGCCRNGARCVCTRWRDRIWFGVTRTSRRVVPTRSRVVVLPLGPPPTSVYRTARGPVSLHRWFLWMTCWCWGSRSCRSFRTRAPTLVGRPRW